MPESLTLRASFLEKKGQQLNPKVIKNHLRLVDVSRPALDRARASIQKRLAKFVEKGRLTAADRDATLGRLASSTDIEPLAEADYVVEAIYENAEAKRALFASLDGLARPDVILASNTSSISLTLLGAATRRPDKVLAMHFETEIREYLSTITTNKVPEIPFED